jgi:hypothetical protein
MNIRTPKPVKNSEAAALLRRAGKTPCDLSDSETLHLMRELLRLPLDYFIAVSSVIREGRWRGAKKQLAYVRKAAETLAKKDPQLDKPVGYNLDGGALDRLCASAEGPVKDPGSGVWHGSGYDYSPDYIDHSGQPVTWGEHLRDRTPQQFKRPWTELDADLDVLGVCLPEFFIDWEQVARAAGLDDGETRVLMYRVRGISRDLAIKSYTFGAKQRLSLTAAWRRFDRKRRLERVATILGGVTATAPGAAPTTAPTTSSRKGAPLRQPLQRQQLKSERFGDRAIH